MRLVRRAALSICLLAFALAGSASAQGGLAYTVQVAALSDPESAIQQSGALLREGFPAYVVRAEGAAGTVFRVRVGAFGDRLSADRYARAMGDRAGGTPRPALAEAIPAGILPLAPMTLTRLSGDQRAVIVPWGDDGSALRLGDEGEEARYEVLTGGAGAFSAWWAAPASDGRQELARLPLDDEAGADDSAEVREALFRQRLRLMADRAGLAEEQVAPAVRGEPGGRYLVAWRTTGSDEAVHGVLAPGADADSRDDDAWLGDVPPLPEPPLLTLQDPSRGDPSSGDGALEDPVAAAPDPASDADPEAGPEPDSDAAPDDVEESVGQDDVEESVGQDDAEEPVAQDDVEESVAPDDAAGEPEAPAGPAEDAPGADAQAEPDPPPAGDEAEPEPAATVRGDGWTATADGRWTTLDVGDVSWRALVGTPVQGTTDLLVLRVDEGLEIVRLIPR